MKRTLLLMAMVLMANGFVTSPAGADPITIYNTGIGAPGSIDPNYELIHAPTGIDLAPVIIDPTQLAWPWAVPTPGVNWIGVTDDDARTVLPYAPSDPGHLDDAGGLYIFRTTFDLTGFAAETVALNGFWAADNLAEIFVNGVSTGISRSGTGDVGYDLQPFALTPGSFLSGINSLEFHVTNLNYQADPGNPVGLLVQGMELEGTPTAVPEPGTLLLLAMGAIGAAATRRRQGSV